MKISWFGVRDVVQARRGAILLLVVPSLFVIFTLLLGVVGVSVMPTMTDFNHSWSYVWRFLPPIFCCALAGLMWVAPDSAVQPLSVFVIGVTITIVTVGLRTDNDPVGNGPMFYFLPILYTGFAFRAGAAYFVTGVTAASSLYALQVMPTGKEIFASWLGLTVFSFVMNYLLVTERNRSAVHEENLREMARRDSLTGLLNRNSFDTTIGQLMSNSTQKSWALLVMDVDHFKELNDTYGHPVGDEVLQGLAHLVSESVSDSGLACRLGGDEFAAVLPTTDAQQCADDLVHQVATTSFGSVEPVQVTISVGITPLPVPFNDLEQAYSQADQAMYDAKANGRNSAVQSTSTTPETLPKLP